jgi:hypothetical protein
MDRDKRWERVEVGMKGMITGEGEDSSDPLQTIKERYEKGETDEFFQPIIVGGKERRVQGMIFTVNIIASTTIQKLTWQQMTIPSSSSTTVRTVFVRLPSSWVTTTAPLVRTSPTPRTSPLPP